MKDEDLTWKEISSEEILDTRVFKVTKARSVSPQGEEGEYIVIKARDWATVIPILGDDFLMVRQWRHGHQGLSIEFPGGVIESDETPEEGARRELMEETGFSAGRLVHLGTINPNPALFANRFHVFLAEDLQPNGKQNLDKDEFLDYIKIPKAEVFEKMGGAEYPHALMVAALELYRQRESRQRSPSD